METLYTLYVLGMFPAYTQVLREHYERSTNTTRLDLLVVRAYKLQKSFPYTVMMIIFIAWGIVCERILKVIHPMPSVVDITLLIMAIACFFVIVTSIGLNRELNRFASTLHYVHDDLNTTWEMVCFAGLNSDLLKLARDTVIDRAILVRQAEIQDVMREETADRLRGDLKGLEKSLVQVGLIDPQERRAIYQAADDRLKAQEKE